MSSKWKPSRPTARDWAWLGRELDELHKSLADAWWPLPQDYKLNTDYLNAVRRKATNQNYTQNGALIHRFADRVFIGGAIENDGTFPNTEKDWLSTYQGTVSLRRVIGTVGTGVTTSGSAVVTFTAGGSTPSVGAYFFGNMAIPAGTTVVSVDSTTQITLSANATHSTTGNTFYSNNSTTLNGTGLAASTFGLVNNSNSNSVGALFGSRSENFTNGSTSCIGIMGVAKNDNATYSTNAWALYLEATRKSSTVGSTYAIEFDVTSTAASETKPDAFTMATSVGIQAAAGCGLAGELPSGVQRNIGCVMQVAANPVSFRAGIVFGNNSIEGTDGVTGTGTMTTGVVTGVATAISFAPGHAIETYNEASELVSRIYTSNKDATAKTELRFIGSGVQFIGDSGQQLALIQNIASAVNSLQIIPAATGNPVQVLATGSDANIDLRLRTTGTGVLRFGTHTGSADVACNGYITIKDDGGTVRKLMTTA